MQNRESHWPLLTWTKFFYWCILQSWIEFAFCWLMLSLWSGSILHEWLSSMVLFYILIFFCPNEIFCISPWWNLTSVRICIYTLVVTEIWCRNWTRPRMINNLNGTINMQQWEYQWKVNVIIKYYTWRKLIWCFSLIYYSTVDCQN